MIAIASARAKTRGAALFLATALIGTTLAGCTSAEDEYTEMLTKAGYTDVKVVADSESTTSTDKKTKKKKTKNEVVAYDFVWTVDTNADGTACEVELEHAATAGSLTGGGWYIDEVNGTEVTDSPPSPGPDAVKAYLQASGVDC